MVFFKSIKKGLLLISISLIILGYFLVVKGGVFVADILKYLSFVLMGGGVINVIRYLLLKSDESFKRNDLVIGLFLLALGGILFVKQVEISVFAPIILAIVIIASGILKIQDCLDAKKVKVNAFGAYITLCIINLAIGAIVILTTLSKDILYLLLGCGLVFSGACDVFSNIYLAFIKARFERRKKKAEKQALEEQEIKEEPVEEVIVEELIEEEIQEEPQEEVHMQRIDLDDPEEEKPLE